MKHDPHKNISTLLKSFHIILQSSFRAICLNCQFLQSWVLSSRLSGHLKCPWPCLRSSLYLTGRPKYECVGTGLAAGQRTKMASRPKLPFEIKPFSDSIVCAPCLTHILPSEKVHGVCLMPGTHQCSCASAETQLGTSYGRSKSKTWLEELGQTLIEAGLIEVSLIEASLIKTSWSVRIFKELYKMCRL